MNKLKLGSLLLATLIAGTVLGAFVWDKKQASDYNALTKRYSLLAKRLFLSKPNDILITFNELRKEVYDYADANIGLENASIYFNYLPTGTTFGYGETREFTGASLIKVPFVMDLYRLAEDGKVNLDTKVPLKKAWLNDEFGSLHLKGEGYKLSYREAARLALRDSDNTALLMLSELEARFPHNGSDQAINALDIPYQVGKGNSLLIGSQSYTSLLKCLYFSCYLNYDDSQEVLRYMTESKFNNRLTLFLPQGLTVAHKIGTYSDEVQSDCGIIYLPNRNYSLCIMLKEPEEEANQHIADISNMVYKFVSKQK